MLRIPGSSSTTRDLRRSGRRDLRLRWTRRAERDLDDIAAYIVIGNLPYVIGYRVRESHVENLRVLHTSRR